MERKAYGEEYKPKRVSPFRRPPWPGAQLRTDRKVEESAGERSVYGTCA
jgi:hypothetical protein